MKTLVIVESPGKIAKISHILGSQYIVKACKGIFRDLDPKKLSIDMDNNFEPQYIITKPAVVKELRTAMKNSHTIFLATDNDTEGHGMAQALIDVLKPKKYQRILFNEISKKAILSGIKNASDIDSNQVAAQKTRRVTDRLFGYGISPIINRNVGGKSAGRVQLAALRIVVDREDEINNFNSGSVSFKIKGIISDLKVTAYSTSKPSTDSPYKGIIAKIEKSDDVIKILRTCLVSKYIVHSVETKPATRSPCPPFTTSTLQQEANRKYHMPIDLTMSVAQKLYEGGYITYMRTDSVEISEDAHKEIKKVIEEVFGTEYYKETHYKNKNSSAQLAHECIRPVHPKLIKIEKKIDDENQIKLYKLIWSRTIASQMVPAKLDITTIQIDVSKFVEKNLIPFYYFQSIIEKIVFMGFMKVYTESVDDAESIDDIITDNDKIPKVGDILAMQHIVAKQEYERPPVRYTQASLVKKLESVGIGRPSTYVNTIKKIIDRSYVEIRNVAGTKKEIQIYEIRSENGKHVMVIDASTDEIFLGKEMRKIVGTNLGKTVIEYMKTNFPDLIDYEFTANLESAMDKVANGDLKWNKPVAKFYSKIKPAMDSVGTAGPYQKKDVVKLGHDEQGHEIIALVTKSGPAVARIANGQTDYANLKKNDNVNEIKLSTALKLLNENSRLLGQYKNENVVIKVSKTNTHYISWGKKQYCPIPPDTKPARLDLESCIKLIEENKNKENSNLILKLDITMGKKKVPAFVMKGKNDLPPYIQITVDKTRKFYSVPQNIDPEKITEKIVKDIISQKNKSKPKAKSKSKSKSKTTKK